jgi:serine O-acetyltransferase
MKSKNKAIYQSNFLDQKIFVSKKKAKYWINELYNWLFCCQKEYLDYTFFENKEAELMTLLIELLQEENLDKVKAEQQAALFFESISVLHEMLLHDLDSVLKFDPAAKSKNEVLLTYPGFFAITVYRIANYLWQNQNYILARLIAEYAHSKTGIDIHPGALIGECFFIDHGTGIVIGETALIGKNVKIYQGLTLGALSVNKEEQNKKRHPTIEDGVIIYANATILGGATIIGKNSTIGGNVWITSSIPEQSMVFHKSEISIKNKHDFPEAINFSI